jgi:branched-chain amino acid transport system substrate-binding protein
VAVEDTGSDPANALEALKRLHAKGAKIVFGPQSSSELEQIMPYAAANGIVILSMGSTASSLAIPNDNVLRFCPPDPLEIKAAVAYLQAEGKTGVVPVWRNDVGNAGLASQMKLQFPAAGGTASAGVSYEPATTDFTSTVADVRAQATALRGTLGNNVGLFFGSFEEAAALMATFPDEDVPGQIAIGGDGMAKVGTFLTPGATAARAFAARNDLVTLTFGLDPAQQAIWGPLTNQIKSMTGDDSDGFSLAAYDSAVIAKRALSTVPLGNATLLRTAIVAEANNYVGATGLCRLDANGDREASTFDFWGLDATPAWALRASYRNGVIIRP